MLLVVSQQAVMLLAVKIKSDWFVSIRLFCRSKVRGYIFSQMSIVCFVVVVNVVCMMQYSGAGSCRQRLSGVCSKLVNQLSRVSH